MAVISAAEISRPVCLLLNRKRLSNDGRDMGTKVKETIPKKKEKNNQALDLERRGGVTRDHLEHFNRSLRRDGVFTGTQNLNHNIILRPHPYKCVFECSIFVYHRRRIKRFASTLMSPIWRVFSMYAFFEETLSVFDRFSAWTQR